MCGREELRRFSDCIVECIKRLNPAWNNGNVGCKDWRGQVIGWFVTTGFLLGSDSASDPTITVTDMVLLPDACTLLLGHTPSSHQQETAPCTGRQTRAARGYHMMNIKIVNKQHIFWCGSIFKQTRLTWQLFQVKTSSLSIILANNHDQAGQQKAQKHWGSLFNETDHVVRERKGKFGQQRHNVQVAFFCLISKSVTPHILVGKRVRKC